MCIHDTSVSVLIIRQVILMQVTHFPPNRENKFNVKLASWHYEQSILIIASDLFSLRKIKTNNRNTFDSILSWVYDQSTFVDNEQLLQSLFRPNTWRTN